MGNEVKQRGSELFALVTAWLIEVLAFVLLPLIVYLAVYFALGIEIGEIMKLPEWMFISIVLSGDFVRTQLAIYQGYRGFHVKAIRAISLGIIFIVTSSIFLVFSLMAQIRDDLTLPDAFYAIQIMLFLTVFYFYAGFSLWERWRKGEGKLQVTMQIETGDIQDKLVDHEHDLLARNLSNDQKQQT